MDPATASLAMSAATFALAIAVIPVSSLSEVFGRRRVMTVSALAASVLGLAATLAPSLPVLVAIRVLQGFALAGVPAVAMAYLAEEVERGSLGRAMGLFIAGNSIGGLTGRIAAGRAGRPRRLAGRAGRGRRDLRHLRRHLRARAAAVGLLPAGPAAGARAARPACGAT